MHTDRVAIYIDGSNLYHSLNTAYGRNDLGFEKFSALLAGSRRLVRMYYYNAPLDQTKDSARYKAQQRFFQALKSVPYLELRLGRMVYRNWPQEQPYEKGVDVKISIDMLVHSQNKNYDVAVLVSGDSDFEDALQAVKNNGQHVEVALLGQNTSQRLRDVADKVIDLGQSQLSHCWRTA